MSNCFFQHNSIKESVEQIKSIGNELFKKGDCGKALRKYRKAIRYLRKADGEASASDEDDLKPKDEANPDELEMRKILISLYLNRLLFSL